MTTTDDTATLVADFLDRFSLGSDRLDPEVLAGCFADTFLAGDADGTRPVPRAAFLEALPRRREMFERAGIGPAALAGSSFDRLDDHYVLLRTTWAAPRTDGGGAVELSSSFLLYRDADAYVAVAYLNHRGL